MADTFVASPRRITAMIRLHAGELCSIVCQPAMLDEFTMEELNKMIDCMHMNLNARENGGRNADR